MKHSTFLAIGIFVAMFIVFLAEFNYLINSVLFFAGTTAIAVMTLRENPKWSVYGFHMLLWGALAYYSIAIQVPNWDSGIDRGQFRGAGFSAAVNMFQTWQGIFVVAILAAISSTVTFAYYQHQAGQRSQPVTTIARPTTLAPELIASKSSDSVSTKPTLEAELEKLAEMKATGLLDDDEYKSLKTKVISEHTGQ